MTTWICWDESGVEVAIDAETAHEAAREYVDETDWPTSLRTWWAHVCVAEEGSDEHERIKITVDPDEPGCVGNGDHDWRSPIEIIGGLRESPGCYGHGGGITRTSLCIRCGCGRVTDSWAQDPIDGEQGLESIAYEPDRFVDRLAELHHDLCYDRYAHEYPDLVANRYRLDDDGGDPILENSLKNPNGICALAQLFSDAADRDMIDQIWDVIDQIAERMAAQCGGEEEL